MSNIGNYNVGIHKTKYRVSFNRIIHKVIVLEETEKTITVVGKNGKGVFKFRKNGKHDFFCNTLEQAKERVSKEQKRLEKILTNQLLSVRSVLRGIELIQEDDIITQ